MISPNSRLGGERERAHQLSAFKLAEILLTVVHVNLSSEMTLEIFQEAAQKLITALGILFINVGAETNMQENFTTEDRQQKKDKEEER